MSDIEVIHPVPVEECRDWLATLRTSLLMDAGPGALDRGTSWLSRQWDQSRTWGARANGRWIATLRTIPRAVTVPGPGGSTVDVAADALSAVTVNATHRRRGVLRQMITASLEAATQRGDTISVLFAAEWPIYGRFGYAPATQEAEYRYRTRGPGAGLERSGDGELRQVTPDELAELAPGIFEVARRMRAGQIDRPGQWWASALGTDGYPPPEPPEVTCIVHDSQAGADGLLRWVALHPSELDGRLGAAKVLDLAAANPLAYRDLWAYLSGIDLIGEITLPRRPIDEPVRWLLADGRALQQTHAGDGMWLRLLDVPGALSARGYAVAGELVIDVVDDDGGYAAGRFALSADLEGATCRPSAAAADLRLSQRALASAYLGGFSLRQVGTGVAELVPGALARMDTMFGTALRPWNQTMF